MNIRRLSLLSLMFLASLAGCTSTSRAPAAKVGEHYLSEDPAIGDFHALGLVAGHDNLFRSAAPLRDMIKAALNPASDTVHAAAVARMKSLYDRGIRTIVSLENSDASEKEDKAAWISLEKAAATQAGIRYVWRPMSNFGANSLEDASDQAVLEQLIAVSDEILKDADSGGVLVHCSAGHDRTGIVVAYLRMKYQHWTAARAIAEMRAMGHNWIKYSSNGGLSSWHEDHLKAIEKLKGF